MTLEEAIIHCKEKACGNTQCAIEHGQLAEWLQELQQYRKNEYIRKDALLGWIDEYKNYSSGPSWDLLKTHIETI